MDWIAVRSWIPIADERLDQPSPVGLPPQYGQQMTRLDDASGRGRGNCEPGEHVRHVARCTKAQFGGTNVSVDTLRPPTGPPAHRVADLFSAAEQLTVIGGIDGVLERRERLGIAQLERLDPTLR
jgi:hypothetical protein